MGWSRQLSVRTPNNQTAGKAREHFWARPQTLSFPLENLEKYAQAKEKWFGVFLEHGSSVEVDNGVWGIPSHASSDHVFEWK